MNVIMNIIWLFLCGFIQWFNWMAAGVLCCITIIGIPIGVQCFKIAGFVLWPFGRRIVYSTSTISFLLNVIWLIFLGVPLAVAALINGALLCLTIIGIPLGLQCFKFAKLAMMPFGATVVKS